MTAFVSDQAAAQLRGDVRAWIEVLAAALRALDELSSRPRPHPVPQALTLAAEHVRIATVLLEATVAASHPRRRGQALAVEALSEQIRRALI
jgi:hypothetical protein